MEITLITEEQKLWLLISAIFLVAIFAFWPLMTVIVWAVALAVAFMPLQKRLSRRLKPSISAALITIMILCTVILVVSVSMNVLLANSGEIGSMISSLVMGIQNAGISSFLPPSIASQLSSIPQMLLKSMLESIIGMTSNLLQLLIQIVIFFLSLSMLLYFGESIWNTLTCNLSPKLASAVEKMARISGDTIYSLIIIQISAAILSFILAIPFFMLLGYGNVILFATMIGLAMLIPLIGAQSIILLMTLYLIATGDMKGAAITVFIGYPLLSGWIDFYYRPVMMGKRVAINPVLMMIGIFAGLPFMGILGFIVGPVLIALVVTGYKILEEEMRSPCSSTPCDVPSHLNR
jgi:predicted PurR-regulated permease PerM